MISPDSFSSSIYQCQMHFQIWDLPFPFVCPLWEHAIIKIYLLFGSFIYVYKHKIKFFIHMYEQFLEARLHPSHTPRFRFEYLSPVPTLLKLQSLSTLLKTHPRILTLSSCRLLKGWLWLCQEQGNSSHLNLNSISCSISSSKYHRWKHLCTSIILAVSFVISSMPAKKYLKGCCLP